MKFFSLSKRQDAFDKNEKGLWEWLETVREGDLRPEYPEWRMIEITRELHKRIKKLESK